MTRNRNLQTVCNTALTNRVAIASKTSKETLYEHFVDNDHRMPSIWTLLVLRHIHHLTTAVCCLEKSLFDWRLLKCL